MRVLLTGSTGFIGGALAEALKARGDLVVPARRASSSLSPGEVGIDLSGGRLDTSRLPGGTLEGIDASVHLAGAPILGRWSATKREAVMSSRVGVGELLVASFKVLERKPSVHVTGSAVGIYGDRGEEVLDEASANGHLAGGFLAEVCRAWDGAAEGAASLGIRTAALRSGVVLGNGGALRVQLPLFKLGLGAKLGSGHQWTSWISLADEVRAILHVIDEPGLSGPLNLTAPAPVRNSELTAVLAKAVHRPALLTVPSRVLELALGREVANEMLLASQRVLPQRLEGSGFSFLHPDLASAVGAAAAGEAPV
ncbi:MAG: TIGR01777 family oxidoreductase [Acidimicrobiales bacterium]